MASMINLPEKQKEFAKRVYEGSVKNKINQLPIYDIPTEALDYLKMLEQASQQLGDIKEKSSGLYGEAVDIAKSQSAIQEAPGASIARDDIKQSTAQQIQNIKEAGGSGVGVIGAISNVGLSEQDALRDLAKQSALYKSQAARNLQGALSGQAGFEANVGSSILGQQASLEGAGLQTMIGEKGKVFDSNLNKSLTEIDYLMADQAAKRSEEEAKKNRIAQLIGGLIGGVTGGVSSYLTGGLAGKK